MSGLVDGDVAGDVMSGGLGRTPGEDVGSYAINLGTLAIAPAYATKYRLPASPAAATYVITPKPVVYTGTVPRKAYDGTTTLPGPVSGSFAAGDIINNDTVTVSGGTYASADAGTRVVVTGVSASGADAGNYDVTFNVSGDITPRAVTAISWVRVIARVADGTTDATFDTGSARGTGVLPGQLADFRAGGLVASGTFPSAEAGSHDLSVTYSLRDRRVFKAGNYTLSAGTATDTLNGQIQDAPAQGPVVGCQPAAGDDYDADDDGLIEVCNLAQLSAVRFDLDGGGSASGSAIADAAASYEAAFPSIVANGPGCPQSGCVGYELTADLDFDTNGNGEADAGDAYWNGSAGWLSIGGFYAAVFDGNDHTVSNLYINDYSHNGSRRGLFLKLAETGVIRNVALKSVSVSSNQNYTGGLVGENRGTISNAGVTGSVSGAWGVRGLVGQNERGTITDSYSSGEVSSPRGSAGGLAGQSWGGRIVRSYSMANVTATVAGTLSYGGLVGLNANGNPGWLWDRQIKASIVASYATGRVSGNARQVGGLVGENWNDEIFASCATGDVSGAGEVGGLVGDSEGIVSASFALGAVSGEDRVGGLIGYHELFIPSNLLPEQVDRSGVTASYWNAQASGQTATNSVHVDTRYHFMPIGTTRTTAELRQPTGYTGIYASWDDLRGINGDSYAWDFGTSLDFPVLRDTGPSVTAQQAQMPDAPEEGNTARASASAALLAEMYQWRNDPRYVNNNAHTDRWDRTLLAFGETVADTTLTPMTAAEAQGYADRGWGRWERMAAGLREIESVGQEEPQL